MVKQLLLEISKLELSKIGFLIAGLWALVQFWSANEFRKTQYLSELWRKFYTTDKFVEIFDLLDRDDVEKFKNIEAKDLFSYLGLLEEIVIFSRTKFYQIYKLRNDNLINLFQYHFYNLYIDENSKTRVAFWNKIINATSDKNKNEFESELQKSYRKLQYQFALKCAESIKKH